MRIPTSVLLAAAGLVVPLTAQDLTKVLPAHTWAYVGHAGLDTAAGTFEHAKLVDLGRNLLGDGGWQRLEGLFRERAGRDLDEAMGAFGRVGLDANRVRALVAGPLALAVGRLTFMGENPMPSLALIAQPKAPADFARCLQDLEKLLGQAAPRVTIEDATIAGIACRRFTLPRDQGAIVHGMVDGTWIATNSPGYLADCAAALRGQVPNLAANHSLTRGRSQLQGARMLEVFVNLQQLSSSVTPLLPYEAAGIGAALGVSDLPDLYAGAAHDGKGASDVINLLLPGAKGGLLKAALSTPASNAAARWVKPSTALFASARIDARGVGAAFDHLLDALPAKAAAEVRKAMSRELPRELKRELGMDPQELFAMLASVGSEVNIAVDVPRPTPPFVNFAVFVELADAQRAGAMLGDLAKSGKLGKVAEDDSDGAHVWTVDAEVEGFQMSPSWGIRDGWLVASNFKAVTKRLLRDGPLAQGSLADDPRFAAASKAAAGASVFVTARFAPLIQNYWGLAAAGIRTGADMVEIEVDEVPTGEDVEGAIDDLVLAIHADETGFVLRQHHPLGVGTLVAASAAGLDWFMRQAARKVY